jgi:hypothetical protein
MALLEDVFKKSGLPTVTFVEPIDFSKLVVALRAKGRSVVVEGPSGIGKSTAVKNALEKAGITSTFENLSARKANDVAKITTLFADEVKGNIIIDDFHKLSGELQEKIANQVKVAADEEREDVNIVIVGINDCGRRLVKFADDVSNRVDFFRFETNPKEKIEELIRKGEEELSIEIETRNSIVDASGGSFYLAQMLCYEMCAKADITETQVSLIKVEVSFEQVQNSVWRELSARFGERTNVFCRGPKFQSAGRAPYLHLLYWLARRNEWSLSIKDEIRLEVQMRGSVGQIVDKGYLAQHIENNKEISAVLHFDKEAARLTIEDPQFAFYLRNTAWNKLAESIGFRGVNFENRYDFALSFSGTSRDIAELIYSGLSSRQIEVFYDRQEEQRILAVDVEEYLEPIYRSEARYVICILDQDYSKRMWPRIEVTKFEERLGKGEIIPILIDDLAEGVFSRIEKTGHFRVKRANLGTDVDRLVSLLSSKLEENRQ